MQSKQDFRLTSRPRYRSGTGLPVKMNLLESATCRTTSIEDGAPAFEIVAPQLSLRLVGLRPAPDL
jgi:hypothetical protein